MPVSKQTTIEKYPLEQKKVIKKTVAAIWGSFLLFLFVYLPAHIFLWKNYSTFIIIADILLGFGVVIQPFYQYWYYKKYFYDVRADFLVIKKGVIMVREIILDYDKVQDVYMDQDLFDRMFSLWDVHVSTATSMSGMEAHIDGVNHDNAMVIRELILAKIRSGKIRK